MKCNWQRKFEVVYFSSHYIRLVTEFKSRKFYLVDERQDRKYRKEKNDNYVNFSGECIEMDCVRMTRCFFILFFFYFFSLWRLPRESVTHLELRKHIGDCWMRHWTRINERRKWVMLAKVRRWEAQRNIYIYRYVCFRKEEEGVCILWQADMPVCVCVCVQGVVATTRQPGWHDILKYNRVCNRAFILSWVLYVVLAIFMTWNEYSLSTSCPLHSLKVPKHIFCIYIYEITKYNVCLKLFKKWYKKIVYFFFLSIFFFILFCFILCIILLFLFSFYFVLFFFAGSI